MEIDGIPATLNDRGEAGGDGPRARPGFYSADHLQLNHYYTRSEAELAAKIGRGPNLVGEVAGVRAQGAAHRGEHRGRRGRGPGGARLSRPDRVGAMRTELIVATYQSPRALGLCLTSVARQTVLPDSISIADDGSGPETAAAIAAFAAAHPELAVRHVWHEDRGFRKAAILNRAIATSEAEFLIFIDGDVMIAPGFIARHLELARPGRFSSGSLIRLDAEATAAVTPEMVEAGGCSTGLAAEATGPSTARDLAEDDAVSAAGDGAALDRATPVQRRSAAPTPRRSGRRPEGQRLRRDDASTAAATRSSGVRLENAGVRGQHLRYTAPLVHLDHPRGYSDPEKIRRHKARIAEVRRTRMAWTPHGLRPGPRDC